MTPHRVTSVGGGRRRYYQPITRCGLPISQDGWVRLKLGPGRRVLRQTLKQFLPRSAGSFPSPCASTPWRGV